MPNPEGGPECDGSPKEKVAAEGVAVPPVLKVVPNAGGFFCGDSIIVSPSDCEFVTAPFGWAPNPPKFMLLAPVFPVLSPNPLNGFEAVCGAKVKDPDGGAAVKLTVEGLDGGKDALVLKLNAGVLLLLPEGAENWLFPPPICPKRFGAVPPKNDCEPVVETPL